MGRTVVALYAGEVAGQGKAFPRGVEAHTIDVHLERESGWVCQD